MCLWCCWKDLDEQDCRVRRTHRRSEFIYKIYLVRFWIQNVGDTDFKVIFAVENSIKFPKNQVLEGKKSVENVVTLEGLPSYQFNY